MDWRSERDKRLEAYQALVKAFRYFCVAIYVYLSFRNGNWFSNAVIFIVMAALEQLAKAVFLGGNKNE